MDLAWIQIASGLGGGIVALIVRAAWEELRTKHERVVVQCGDDGSVSVERRAWQSADGTWFVANGVHGTAMLDDAHRWYPLTPGVAEHFKAVPPLGLGERT